MSIKDKIIKTLVTLIISVFWIPYAYAVDHTDGQIRVNWDPSTLYLNSSNYLEQEIILDSTTAIKDNAPFRWANQYHIDFAWRGTNSSPRIKQAYVGLALGSKSGNTYSGEFRFTLFTGAEYSLLRKNSDLNCAIYGEPIYVDNLKTSYISCDMQVVIEFGTPYLMRVQWDSTNTSSNNNWWSASLINKNTNETFTIGRIKQAGNQYEQSLVQAETVVYYQGDPAPCDSVPNIDLHVSPFRNKNVNAKFMNYRNLACVRAVALPSKTLTGYYQILLGGSDPATRSLISEKENIKPPTPILTGIRVSNNVLNISVNLNSDKTDLVYLVSSKLTSGVAQKILGEISGKTASWRISFDPKKINGIVPITFVSSANGVLSDEVKVEYVLPSGANSSKQIISKSPAAPRNITSKYVDGKLIVTAKVVTSGNSSASKVLLFSDALNKPRSKSLLGSLLNDSVVFSIPVKASDLTKKIDLNLVAVNEAGSSPVSRSTYGNSLAKKPAPLPTQNKLETVICTKGSLVRTFEGTNCPPGWLIK